MSSSLRCVGNKLLYPRVARNVHLSSKLKVDPPPVDKDVALKKDPLLKKGPTETEKRVMMALKFSAAFLPGVYIGAFCQRKGYFTFNSKKANTASSTKTKEADVNETSSILGSVTGVPKKIEGEKKEEVKEEKK